jgi:hypothetical protein
VSEYLAPAEWNRDAIRWGQDNPIDAAPKLSEAELALLEQKRAALDRLLAEQGKAKYKIEIFFAHTRRAHGRSIAMLSLWESGAKLHGGGDAKVYWCPGKDTGRSTCAAAIPDHANGYGFLVCPRCKTVWPGAEVRGELLGRWSNRQWAEILVLFFRKLDHNADIYLKYPKHDLRIAAHKEQVKQRMGEELERVRRERVRYIYPLRNILKDTASGADLLGRFNAFLNA